MLRNAALATRAADFCRAHHPSLRDLSRENFWTAVKSLPAQVARTLASSRLTAGLAIAAPAAASATTYNVTSASDAADSDGGVVPGTLRDAINQANANPGADTITFDAALNGQTISLYSQLPIITDDLTITGPGSAQLTIDGNKLIDSDGGVAGGSRIFYLYALTPSPDGGAPTPKSVTISGMTLQNGIGGNNDAGQNGGGAIFQRATALTLSDVVLKDNLALGSGGGASANSGGSLEVVNSTVTGNSALAGGGLFLYGASGLLVADSTISNNTADHIGGGICEYSGRVTQFTVANTTISGNTATFGGAGAFYHSGYYGGSFVNSTIVGNTATKSSSGGLALYGVQFTYIGNTTISGNIGTAGRPDPYANGAGLYVGGTYPVLIKNAIIAGNTVLHLDGGASTTEDIAAFGGTQVLSAFSLIQNPGVATFVDQDGGFSDAGMVLGEGNIVGEDPLLGVLADNGGTTLTMLPSSASPAVNAGDPTYDTDAGLPVDQRGQPRIFGTRIDMGAVEIQTASTRDAGGSASDGGSTSGSDAGGGTTHADGGAASKAKAGCACNGTEADAALALLAPIGTLLLRRRRSKR